MSSTTNHADITTQLTITIGDNRLAELGHQIREADAGVRQGVMAAADRTIEAGQALIEAKALVKHGQWQVWLREHCGLSDRTAQRYMQIASSGLKSATVADLGIGGAAAAIAKKRGAKPLSPEGRERLIEFGTIWFNGLVRYAGLTAAKRQAVRSANIDFFVRNIPELLSVYVNYTMEIEHLLTCPSIDPDLAGLTFDQPRQDVVQRAIKAVMSERIAALSEGRA